MKIIGVGLDLVSIPRIRSITERWRDQFLTRLFTQAERDYCLRRAAPYASLAARFAAKEAVLKALGTGWTAGIRWVDIQVVNDSTGKPTAQVSGRVKELMAGLGATTIHVSLAHEADYAIAEVVLTAE
jgi:holo-[acyl-carrier protein] synthase